MIGFSKRRRAKKSKFNPNRDFVNSAVQDFLEQGGHIHKIEAEKKDYQDFLTARETMAPADEFLMDLVGV